MHGRLGYHRGLEAVTKKGLHMRLDVSDKIPRSPAFCSRPVGKQAALSRAEVLDRRPS